MLPPARKREARCTRPTAPVLHAPTALTTDASAEAVGVVLQQEIGGTFTLIAFFSKRLEQAQRQYSAFDRELLAIYEVVRYFQHFLEGRKFFMLTDHKPLTYTMSQAGNIHSPRIAPTSQDSRQTLTKSRGENNEVADTV